MAAIEQEIIERFHRLDETGKRRVLASLAQEISRPPHKMTRNEWETFVAETYGSLADDPIERGPELPPVIRDEVE